MKKKKGGRKNGLQKFYLKKFKKKGKFVLMDYAQRWELERE